MTEPSKLSLPSLKAMFKLRAKLIEELSVYENSRVDDVTDIVDAVFDVLPDQVPYDVVVDSLRHLISHTLTKEMINNVSHRIAGNLRRLKAGRSAPPWVCQRFGEWVPVQILAAQRRNMRSRNHGDKVGAELTLKIMTGTCCPLIITKWRSLRWLFHFSTKMGFSKRSQTGRANQFPYLVPEQYTSLRMAVWLDPQLSRELPGFRTVDVPASLRLWNKSVLKKRARIDFTCMENYPTTVPCHRCWRGYESCPVATHRRDFVEGKCPRCSKTDQLLDLDQGGVCQLCIRQINDEEAT